MDRSSVQSTYLLLFAHKKMSKLSSVCGRVLPAWLVAYSAAICRFLGKFEISSYGYMGGFSVLRVRTERNFHSLRQFLRARIALRELRSPKSTYLLPTSVPRTADANAP